MTGGAALGTGGGLSTAQSLGLLGMGMKGMGGGGQQQPAPAPMPIHQQANFQPGKFRTMGMR
jgi:hypothetical protein